MKILLLLKQSPADEQALSLILHGIRTLCPDFSWQVVHSLEEYLKVDPCFRVLVGEPPSLSGESDSDLSSSNLIWPSPGKILKDPLLKEKIWEQIQLELIPAFLAVPALSKVSIDLTSEQIKKILLRISDSTAPFTFTSNGGLTVGVNLSENLADSVDVSLSAADLSSMLAAAWVFGANCIELPRSDYVVGSESH